MSVTTTLTREALLGKCQPVYKEVDVDGFGTVGLRELGETKRLRRINQMFDGKGNLDDTHSSRRRLYMIIDQVMVDESTPMFTEADIATLSELGSGKLDSLVAAIVKFNEDLDPNGTGESSDTSDS